MAFPETKLKNSAQTIHDAKTEGFNTAQRVGQMFLDIIKATNDEFSAESTTRSSAITALQTSILTAQQRADNAYSLADTANATANAAKTAAATAQQRADNAYPRTVNIQDIDTMGVSNLRTLIANASGNSHCTYTVLYDGGFKVGVLHLFSDFSGHVLTQVLETHHAFKDGELQVGTHNDDIIRRYFRSYNFNSPYLGNDPQTWTEWQECIPENVPQLDASGKIATKYLPGYVDDVVEFHAIVDGITLQENPTSKKSTDAGCMVMYNEDTNCFVLAVAVNPLLIEEDWSVIVRPTRTGTTLLQTPSTGGISQLDDNTAVGTEGGNDKYQAIGNLGNYWLVDENGAVIGVKREAYKYYTQWDSANAGADEEAFGIETENGRKPIAGKIYTCTSTNKTYRWGSSSLIIIGSDLALGYTAGSAYPGDEGLDLANRLIIAQTRINDNSSRIDGLGILPADGYWNGEAPEPTSGVWLCPSEEDSVYFRSFGYTNFYGIAEEVYNSDMTYNPGWLYRLPDGIYRINNNKFESISGAGVGNTYNVTVAIPLPANEYYSDINAKEIKHNVLDAVYAEGKAALGLTITFAIGVNSWKTYQYVGPNVTPTQFKDPKNWIDMAGMSAGAEAVINVDALCPREIGGFYDKGSAIDAILALQSKTGINYYKEGLVITFKVGERKWEAYQFCGSSENDFSIKDDVIWPSFGSGGKVEVSADPARNGTQAFSTGGAYDMLQNAFDHLESDEDGENNIVRAINKRGGVMGEEIKIAKSTGGGQSSGTSLNIYLENPAVYAAYGSEISVRAAIRSITYETVNGNTTEIPGVIRKLEIVDATSGLTLWTENINQNSSTSATNYTFKYDFTAFFTEAAEKDFTVVAYDADGNQRRRTITVTAVDVTVRSEHTLYYKSNEVLEPGGSSKNLLMYSFPNNVSKQGVKAYTEIYINGEWKPVGEALITDTYSHNVTIDPNNVCGGGEKLVHGSYPLRMYGIDVASGVKGNVITTTLMCVDPKSTEPIVAIEYNDTSNGTIQLYENLEVTIAAYTPGKTETNVDINVNGKVTSTEKVGSQEVNRITRQVQGFPTDGSASMEIFGQSGNSKTGTIKVKVEGSAISAVLKDGAVFSYDFSSRSNAEADHTISDNGYTMNVIGSNWSSNGFKEYLGATALAIKENVRATIPYAPFGSATAESTNGLAFQFAFATNNVKDEEAKLMDCYDPETGTGFYICGNKIVVGCKTGNPGIITRPFKCGEIHTVAVVVEPSSMAVTRGSVQYSTIKLYVDGEEIGAIGYVKDSGAILNRKTLSFNGTDADFYLYYVLPYDSYYEWSQAFPNYICKKANTDEMISEFKDEDVLTNTNVPSVDKLKEKGIPYYVVVADPETFKSFDGDINTSTNFECTLYYYHPTMPWRSFKAVHVRWRRQGTTSAKRPIKNDRFYLRKNDGWAVTPLYPDYDNEDALKTYELFKIGYVRVGESTIPVAIITVKVDYSDSSMANDCGVCDMMNATFRALGSDYMTPAQRYFDGTWSKSGVKVSGLQMNHSTANHPIAAFRAYDDNQTGIYFHARGNWKEDKGEQVALGFQNTPGYNLGCLNYGDFIEFFGRPGETLDQTMARFKTTEGLNTSKPYVLSQYCGRNYRTMRFQGGEWARTTGSMKQVNGKWVITGDVLNPVSGYELLTYADMDWFMGVGSIEDMMAPVESMSSWVEKLKLGQATYPAWTQYFECMIDDDQLQKDLAMGYKVPYDLFLVMQFCNSCDYSKEELKNTWQQIWKEQAWRYMSVQSLMAYYTFTDYLAAVDQQAKNMQPMFFLEDGCWVENGEYHSPNEMEPVRMYFNKVYDCDTCNGKDNDGGNTIPAELDPMEDDHCYAGRGSILWNDLRLCENQEMVCGYNTQSELTTLTLPGVVATMRELPAVAGIGAGPFSPQGALHYFVEKRINFWPKLICTYDCERKYIKYTGYNDIYYYALHGSGRQALPRFIEQRWRVRDGYYQTGDFKDASHILGGRIGAKPGAVIKFRAGKNGYYGIGNDSGKVSQGMYLKAGEAGTFTNFQHGDNILLYIYQADQMSEIDLSQISLDPNFQFSQMRLAEKIVIGSENHRQSWKLSTGNTGYLTSMVLGELPFLRHLDVRTTEVTDINASLCPRLEVLYAAGSDLTTLSLAETSPINTLQLPSGISELKFVNLPNLTYPGGLTMESMANVRKLILTNSPGIDPYSLIKNISEASSLKSIRLPDVNITAPSSILTALRDNEAVGIAPSGTEYNEYGQCSGITGRWICEDLVSESLLASLKSYFPQLSLYNAQYSCVMFDDADDDCENITNLDNGTSKEDYEASGHFVRIFDNAHAYKTTYDSREKKLRALQLSDANYNLMADGTEYDPTDQAGEGFDIMLGFGLYWYKGINDFKNQKKYLFACSYQDEPLSTALHTNRKKLADILVKSFSCVFTQNNGTPLAKGDDYEITDNANMNVYSLDVDGMKQVRWPGLNNAQIGAVFVDDNDKVVGTFNMAVSHSLFDFTLGDYVFCDVPSGAKRMVFTSPTGFDDLEAIAVDSNAIEAIEPDWVWVPMRFVAVYGMSMDALMRPRSISGVKTRCGDGTSSTNPDWKYDSDGRVTNASVPTSTMHYTYKDMMNLIEMRGEGYHAISYEISKDIANLVMALTGTRDIQAYAGYGCGSQYTTGANNFNTYGKVTRKYSGSNIGNIIFGIQNFVGCNWEVMEHICCNVPSYKQFRKDKWVEQSSYPIDAKYHLHNPFDDTERVVQGMSTNSGYCIGRVKFGRYADVIASRTTTDNSKWNKNYSDVMYYTASRGRCVGRSHHNAAATGGLVFSSAGYASSFSYTSVSSRLAFSGPYEIVVIASQAENVA